MIEEIAQVTQVSNDHIIVESQVKSSCSSCHQSDTCGSGIVAKAIPHKKLSLKFQNNHTLIVGDKVTIGIPEKGLLLTALQVYIWPLIGLLSFSAFGQWMVSQQIIPHEFWAIVFGVFGGYLGHRIARNNLQSSSSSYELAPKLLGKVISTHSVT